MTICLRRRELIAALGGAARLGMADGGTRAAARRTGHWISQPWVT